MTVSSPPPELPLRLLLTDVVGSTAAGERGESLGSRPWALVEAVAPELAARLALPARPFPSDGAPAARLAALQSVVGSWLTPLPGDPGAWLGPAGRWADLLGAFRQPTALLVAGDLVGGGLAAATTALLEGAGVPVVGLIQWGGAWDPDTRRAEGLPWLGWVEPQQGGRPIDPASDPLPELAQVLGLRWRALDQLGGQSGSAASVLS